MKTLLPQTAIIALGLGLVVAAQAQRPQLPGGYPAKPARILVGSSPGGGVDTISRAVAQRLAEH